MDCSIPVFPVYHQLPELIQTHVRVSDAIQPSHPLLSPSSPTFILSQHQDLCQWVSALHQVAKILEFQLQHQFFQWTPRTDLPLGLTGWISLQSKGLSRVFSKPQFKSISASALNFLYSPTLTSIWLLEKPKLWLDGPLLAKECLCFLMSLLSRLVITFLPRSKRLLISWLQSPSAVILEPPKIKSLTVSIVSPSIFHEVMGPDTMILVFWMLSFKPTFSLSSRGSLVLPRFLP